MAYKYVNRAWMLTATAGTGTVTLGAAKASYLTFAEAGLTDGDTASYCIREGNDFEIGVGTYTASGTTFSRDTVIISKIGGTAGTTKMTLAGAAEIFIAQPAEEILKYDADLEAIGALAGTSGFLKKTGANTWTLDTATYTVSGHTHAIADTTGLQAALDAKAPLASPALTGTPTAPTAAAATNTTQIATTAFVQTELAGVGGMPSGVIVPFAGTTEPSGWLFCYGQAVSRTTYAALFTALSTTYGAGDGSTTFNLPDLRGRVPAGQDDMGGASANRLTNQSGGLNGDTLGATGGAETHTLVTAEMPAHGHRALGSTGSDGSAFGLNASQHGFAGETSTQGSYQTNNANGNPFIENTGGGGAHNNVQPTIILNYIIKT